MRKILLSICLLSILAWTGCGGSKDDDFGPLPGGGGETSAPSIPLTATLKGKIVFEGQAPMPKKIQTSADPACKNPDLVAEDVVVSDGGLENVVISVSGGLEGKSFPANKEPVELDQVGCHYIPHALTLQTNQPLVIKNGDDTAHNVHAWAEVNAPFNESQASKGLTTTKTFTKEEMMLPVRCDVHNWMNAFIGVFAHPLHTVSKKGGVYEMKMPVGTYEITAHHETKGKQMQMVELAEGATVELNFTFKAN